ncbi:MAG: TatD family hydrolase [Verrucomicrobia bacterium]|nr:TatD family hydrolase [Verrucomicrobiota bacterium]MCH8510398.1 TatD family hydrolase [Kiritimatiellia bacterium]
MYTDSHFHLDHFELKGNVPEMIDHAREAQVNRLIAIGGSDEANALALKTAKTYPGTLWATAGYDRDLSPGWDRETARLRETLSHPEVVAVGESGLDYFHKQNDPEDQKILFEAMLDLAAQTAKPMIIHSREAEDDTLAMLTNFSKRWPDADRPCGVLHCFTGSADFARKLLDLNLMISFSGIVTFKNAADIREAAKIVPADRLLIETDSPYLAPHPFRGERNQPALVPHVAACLAECRETTPEDIAETTTQNAIRFFGLHSIA